MQLAGIFAIRENEARRCNLFLLDDTFEFTSLRNEQWKVQMESYFRVIRRGT